MATVAFGATLACAPLVTSAAPFPTTPGPTTRAIPPDRVLDTRAGVGASAGRVDPGETLVLKLPEVVSDGATAVSLNLTAADATTSGYVTAWPCDQAPPATSVLNFSPAHAVPNLITLRISSAGLCMRTSASTHLIGDLMGWFTDDQDFSGSAPHRLLDTRAEGARLPANTERRITVAGGPGVGADAAAVAVNATVTQPTADGWITVYPCGASPDASTVNFRAGEDVANLTFVGLSGDDLCVWASVSTHLVLDTFGWSDDDGDVRVQSPKRILDTRQTSSWPYGPAKSTSKLTLHIAGRGGVPTDAAAALVTVTAADGHGDGYVTVWPCDETMPEASTLNLWHGVVRSNLALVDLAADDGTICLQAKTTNSSPIHLIVDAVGWITGGPDRPEPPAGFVPPGPTATPSPSPSGGSGYFSTLPPGTPLPSDSECAARVRRAGEIRPANATFNHTTGAGMAQMSGPIYGRVTGNFTGTTDEIIQWAACKWGLDEDIVRAQTAKESWWFQSATGDYTYDSSKCVPGQGYNSSGQCPESIGMQQVRYDYWTEGFPAATTSTAYNLDYALAARRNCFEGNEGWLNSVDRGAQYGAGDLWGCLGAWFAGRWHTQAAEGYISDVKGYLDQRIWEQSEFINSSG